MRKAIRGAAAAPTVPALAVALAAALALGACAPEKPAPVVEEQVPVATVAIREVLVPCEISCFGTITFTRKIDLSATVEGTVARLLAKEGQAVREGQRLLELKNVQLQLRRQQALSGIDSTRSSFELAEAKLWEGELAVEARMVAVERTELEREQKRLEVEDAERTLANKEELAKVGGVTPEALSAIRLRLLAARNEQAMIEKDLVSRRIGLRDDDLLRDGKTPAREPAARTRQLVTLNTKTLKADVEAARARCDSARRELEASEELLNALLIDAPAAGVVGAKYVEPGEYVAQNGKMLTLMDTKTVYAALSVQEAEMPLLREGMPARL
jgi:multidrug efflux pump subunit AcrA (membrane-fusion protein)